MAELARRLDVHLPQVEAALNAVGYRIELTVLAA